MLIKENIYIYGAGSRGRELLSLISTNYNDYLCVNGFIDKSKKGAVEQLRIVSIDKCEINNTIVISIADFEIALDVAIDLKNKGFKNVYWYNTKTQRKKYYDFFAEQCVSCSKWNKATLLHVEMHAMDSCNLNCKGCTHYSPIFERKKPDTDSRLHDIETLGEKIGSIANFYILGGEPLLNDEIEKYVMKVKEIFSDAAVVLVTNGLLLPKCSAEFLNYLSRNNICVSISEYEPTHRNIDKIINILCEHNVVYKLRPYDTKQKFNLPLSKEKTNERFCISDGCINVWNGLIARCPTLMYVPMLNRRFNLKYPEEGIFKLKEINSEIEIKNMLQRAVPLCDYCSKNEIEWGTCGKEVSSKDFIMEKESFENE